MADRVCGCGQPVPAGRRGGFCSSWCQARHEQGQSPQPPPGLLPSGRAAHPSSLPSPAADGDASRAARGDASLGDRRDGSEPAAAAEPQRPAYRQRRRKIADEVEDRLREAGMLDTYQAAQVLDLADALDWQGGSLSARATAHRELERQMSELLRGQGEPGSAVSGYRDEVAERRAARAARRAAGGGS